MEKIYSLSKHCLRLTIPIGIFLSAIIKLVIEFLFIKATAEETNKSLEATIGLFLMIDNENFCSTMSIFNELLRNWKNIFKF